MDIAEGYEQGVDSFLRRKIDKDDLLDIAKTIGYCIVPGGLVYRESKKPKEERRTRKAIIYAIGLVAAGAALKIGIVYGGKVAVTGYWSPFKFNEKEKTEQVEGISNEGTIMNRLEKKTVDYEDLLRK